MNDGLTIPEFLRRTPQESVEASMPSQAPDLPPRPTRPLTGALKARAAHDIVAAVGKGHDTFGKLRKHLGKTYQDRELKAGINLALREWLTIHRGPRASVARLGREGRKYSVISA